MQVYDKSPCILLLSSWQSVNIGDIAHTPGMIRALQRYYPEAQVVLWPRNLGHGAKDMLLKYFPDLLIVHGGLSAEGKPDTQELAVAWERADFLLHGSGPLLVGYRELEAWYRDTGKPSGVLGITTENPPPERVAAINHAEFLLTRDSLSIRHARESGMHQPVIEFCPDATFACDLQNKEAAEAYLSEEGLGDGHFVCMIPRLRYTPYYKIHSTTKTEEDEHRDAINSEYAEQDHAKMRAAIIRIARETQYKILLCPEMTYQIDIMDELLVEPLPEDVKECVMVRRRYWLPDEAAAIYAQAKGVVSFECHSPILALRQGTPVIYLQQPTDTIKGQMWRDIGLSRYILEIDDVSADELAVSVMSMLQNEEETNKTMKAALEFADDAMRRGIQHLRNACGSPANLIG